MLVCLRTHSTILQVRKALSSLGIMTAPDADAASPLLTPDHVAARLATVLGLLAAAEAKAQLHWQVGNGGVTQNIQSCCAMRACPILSLPPLQ